MSLSVLSATVRAHATEAEGPKTPKAADLRVAADRFDEGRAAFKAAAYAEAAAHFEAADARAPSSSALTLAMRSHAEAGHFTKAASLAELVLVRYAEYPELVTLAEGIVSAHSAELGRLEIGCQVRCELVIDQKLVHGEAATVWRIYLESGSHVVVANFEGDREAVVNVEALAGTTTTLSLLAPPLPLTQPVDPLKSVVVIPRAPEPATKANHGLPPTVFWVGVGVTAVLGGITVWSGIDTQNNPGPAAVREACAGKGTDCLEYQEGQSKELRTNLLIGGTSLLAVATALTGVFATDFNRVASVPQRGAPNWSLRPVASVGLGQMALLGAEGRF